MKYVNKHLDKELLSTIMILSQSVSSKQVVPRSSLCQRWSVCFQRTEQQQASV